MSIQEQTPAHIFERIPQSYEYHEVEVHDVFETSEHDRITASLREIEAIGYNSNTHNGDTDIQRAIDRKRLNEIDYSQPAISELIRRVEGVEYWLALVPTPRALSSLYNPDTKTLPLPDFTEKEWKRFPFNRLESEYVIGDELRNWMIEIADARGLRYRAQMVTDLLIDVTERQHAKNEQRSKWLSIASGAAQQVINAAEAVTHEYGEAPEMTLVDLSDAALGDAEFQAELLGVDAYLKTEKMNVLRRQGLDAPIRVGELALQRVFNRQDKGELSRNTLSVESYDVVEAVGILEYLKPENWKYRYNKVANLKTKQAGAVRLLENSYRLVKPGGDLLVGNMLDTHPQLGFTLNTIQWPHVQPRSVDAMMDIFDEAGLEGERHVYVPSDAENRVYALYRIHKPESERT